MVIGIYGLSSQSGMAYFADYANRGYDVIGYARPSSHGLSVIDAIMSAGGIYMERPQNSNHEESRFIPLGTNIVTSDVDVLVESSDIVIIALPSIYQTEAVQEMMKVPVM